MKKNLKVLTVFIICIAMILSFVDCKRSGDSYVAQVGSLKITQDEYTYFLWDIRSQLEANAGLQDDKLRKEFWESKDGNQTKEEYAKELALEKAREYKILFDKAKAAGCTLDKKEITEINNGIDNNLRNLGTGKKAEKAYEELYGLSVEKMKSISKDLRIAGNFYNSELTKIQVSEEEIKKHYDENLQSYQAVTVKHVLFLTVDENSNEALPQGKQEEAKKNAEDILDRVKAGEDIGSLVKQYSQDTASKDTGGEYTFIRGQMMKEFEDWSFSAKVGDVGLVKTQYGYHVIRLQKILDFNDVKEMVKADTTAVKYADSIELWKKDSKYSLKKNDKVYNGIKLT